MKSLLTSSKNDYFQKKLNGYEFPVYSTKVCPRNQTEWNARSSAINCTENNGYICIPNRELTKLLEFCYIDRFIWIQESKHCFYICKQDRNNIISFFLKMSENA